ncbi:amino acid adenylation domain-containing protein, partial [Nonomuraea sp. NPDC049269]|uniref:amino acid adenylation domain-containing protein n=1 Tax=Nonomuraea sp. NPDC049269 TaxID=3364349 RepID=UPI00372305AA
MHVYLTDGRLRFLAPKNALTAELREQVAQFREEMVEFLREREAALSADRVSPILPAGRDQPLPLSFAQQRLWFLAQLDPRSVEYNMPTAIPLPGDLDLPALGDALTTLIERHEVLRTRLVAGADGIPHQVIDPPTAFDLPVVKVADEQEAHALITADATTPFDLAAGPLLRGTLIRLADDLHILALCMHHVICDEWSAKIFQHELMALYDAFRTGRPSPLKPLTVQYADFAVWQRGWLTGKVLNEQLTYWREQLADPPALNLPTDRSRPPVRTTAGAAISFRIEAETARRLQELTRRSGSTMFMTLFAAFSALLGRYSAQDDVLVGTPVANRNQADAEDLIGFFVNTLVLRSDLSGDPTFTELLARVRTTALNAFTHQDLPFEQLVDELGVDRDRSRTPLFEALFNYTAELDGVHISAENTATAQAAVKFDLVLSMVASGDTALVGSVQYSTALFDQTTIERLVGHLRVLLDAVVADPDRPLSALPILTSAELQALREVNATGVVLPEVAGVHELIAARAVAGPEAVAVAGLEGQLSYGELDARANQLAHQLIALGAGPETTVALCLERGLDLVTSVLAVWKAGAAYLPLDPSYPTDRLAYLLSDSRAHLLLTTGPLLPSACTGTGESADSQVGRPRTLLLDEPGVQAGLQAFPVTAPPVSVVPDQAAYLIYTSGSTGRPKGVRVAHRGLVNLVMAQQDAFGVTASSRVLQFASPGFDAAVSEIAVTLATGATLLIPSSEQRVDDLAGFIREWRVDTATLPPSLLATLVPAELPPLTLISAGEHLDPALAQAWGDRHRLLNAYGPTETTVCATISHTPATIGAPIANTTSHVLDAHLNPAPTGVPGELFVGGIGLAHGYHGRPALTAERFVADPHAGDGSRLYRTGDLVAWRPDGQLDFLGRTDHQVKIRGHRIEPGEIQHALTGHAEVGSALVTTFGEDADRRLVAYLTPAGPDANIPTTDDLRVYLAAGLPDYMIPSGFIELAAFPLTPNGKIDRAVLPAPDGSRPDLAGGYQAPATPTEHLLAGIWADLLGVDQVGIRDNFFDLGGHSLLATQVTSRIRSVFGIDLSLAVLFDQPTVGGLAPLIDEANGISRPRILPVDRDQPLPLSFAQQRLWFLAQFDPDSTEHNTPTPIPLPGELDIPALRAALTALTERHEVLRTRLVADADGIPHQIIDPPTDFDLPVIEVASEHEAQALIAADAATPFDLAAGPLLRGSLIRISDQEHILALCMHHVISDEWSAKIFHRELLALYEAFQAGRPSPLVPLPVQYADFAVWQRSWLTGETLEEQLGYWRRRLAQPPVLDLPTDRPRAAIRDTAGAALDFHISPEVAEGLRALSRRSGTTMFMTLLAAYSALLGRYTRQDDLLVGTPVANRNQAETEDLIGFFVNTLVLRTDLSGDPTFTELLHRVRATALEAYGHQDLPFEQLVDELGIDRDRSRTPLFQTLFNYFAIDDPTAQELQEATAGGGQQARVGILAQTDLRMIFAEGSDNLSATIEYSTALFDQATIERLIGHLNMLLAAVTTDPDRPLSALPILTPAELQALREVNATGVVLPEAAGVHELIAARALAGPEMVAVAGQEGQLSYGELDVRANQLAHKLIALGAGPETTVALCLERGLDLVVAVLAVWKAGAAYLPLDPSYPTDRLAYLLSDSQAGLLLSTEALLEDLPAGRLRTLLVDEPSVRTLPVTAPAVNVAPDQAAYLIYTSGSTGRPKGVRVAHRGLVNLVMAQQDAFGVTASSRVLQFASPGFDAAVSEIAVTLAAGATLVIPSSEQRVDDLAGFIREWRVDTATLPPSLLATLEPAELPPLTLISAGEHLDAALAEAWGDGHRLLNAYGPTETTVCATISQTPASIGPPIANTTAYVLDGHLGLVPVGVPGELFVGGLGLARGYHGRPALTAERFIADPHAGDGSRLYRTGDLGAWRPDGQLDFLGRTDHQVKIRGHRIEPGEIQHALTSHPHIATALVTPTGQDTDRRLVAYLVPADPADGIPATDDLRAYLAAGLPDYMIPSVFIELAAFPLSPNGKIDRAALPAPDSSRPDLAGSYQPPTTPTEQLLAGIWADLLGVDRIGVRDNFFDLGGHSLLATQVTSRIRSAFGTDVALAALFDQPTINSLATLIDQASAETARPPIVPADRDQPLPLSFAQQRLWFLAQLDPDSAEYNTPTPIPLPGDLDIPALHAALTALTERHEVLRTRLVADAHGIPHQIIDPPTAFDLPVVEAASEEEAQTLIAADAVTPFNLAAGPLLRGTLIRLADDLHILALCMHHVISDEWSAKVFHRELTALYEAFRTGNPSPLAPLPVQYADFALWQRNWLTGQTLEEQLGYWRRQLANPPVLDLPTDRSRPPVRSTAGGAISFRIEAETAGRLQELTRQSGSTMFMTLFAAFSALLGKYSAQDDVLVGTPVANRNQAETEDLIGFFVNTLVLRTDLSGDPTFTDLLHQVRATALDAYGHQDLPFEQLVDELGIDRDRSRTPLFQTLFNYIGESDDHRDADEPIEATVQESVVKFDLVLSMVASGDQDLAGSVQYSTALFDQATIERLIGHLRVLLDAVVAAPDRPLSALPILTTAELQTLRDVNATGMVLPEAAGVHELIAARAVAGSEAVAVGGLEGQLSYGELDARANQLAHKLIALGAGPETTVALCLERGLDLVVAVLAVWKAGAAYLPLDPSYPMDRLVYLLADSQADLLLTTESLVSRLSSAYVGADGSADSPVGRLRTLLVDEPGVLAELQALPVVAPAVVVVPDQAAYLIYTSGSTGRPKGVRVAHRGLVNLVVAQGEAFGVSALSRVLQFASPGFDAAVSEIAVTLAAGAMLVIPNAEQRTHDLASFIQEWRVDTATLPPSLLATLDPAQLPPLTVISAGEHLDPALAQAWGDRHRLLNAYGPTETTVCATISHTPATIGTPISNATTQVLDSHLNPVPAGVPGELFVGGLGLARGYHGRPALTAERFVADPHAGDGSRLYRTGDLATWRPDGQLDFLGRTDHQVKIRGHRIEPGEIQHALTGHPNIAAALVAPFGQDTDRRLVAYLVPAASVDGTPATDDLRAYLAAGLPDYMIPSVFIELAAFPLSPSGKIDRAALPAPDGSRPDLAGGYQAPATPTEQLLAGIWADLLGLDQVGVRDNFFDLGGHSLLATQAITRIRSTFGTDLALAVLFDRPTIKGLASLIDSTAVTAIAPPIVPVDRDQPLPLSFAQQRLWFLAQLDPRSAEYNTPTPIPLPGDLDIPALRAALTALTERHEVLRTRLVADADGIPHQIIDPPSDFDLPVIEVASEHEAQALIAADAAAPFDLAQGPLLRGSLIRLSGDLHILALCMHHVVFDEWSAKIFHEELASLYDACREGRPSPLVPLPVQYADFAVWQRSWLTGETLEEQLGYWRRRLARPPVLDLPTDRPRAAIRDTAGAALDFHISPEVAEGLRALSRRSGTTMFMTLLAAYSALLGRYTRQDDLLVGTPVANRNQAETEDLIGFFVNTL